MQRPTRPIALIGPMGCGKSTVARALATLTQRPVVDLDARIEQLAGQPIAHIFATQGEPAFRALEREVLTQLLQGEETASSPIIATGGGAVLLPANREVLSACADVVWLQASLETRLARLRHEAESRPLLNGSADLHATLMQLDAERTPLYAATAHLAITTDAKPPEHIALAIVTALQHHRQTP